MPNSVSKDLELQTSLRANFPVSHLTVPPPGQPANVLLFLGSFSPITYAHVRLIICAYETLVSHGYHVCGAYISPTSDAYGKPYLQKAEHRIAMARIATSALEWLAVDSWEAVQPQMIRSYEVARRIKAGVSKHFGDQSIVHVHLVCGEDLWENILHGKGWPEYSVNNLVQTVSFAVAPREQRQSAETVHTVNGNRVEIVTVEGWIPDLSSTKLRACLAKGKSVVGMTHPGVVEYITSKQLQFE